MPFSRTTTCRLDQLPTPRPSALAIHVFATNTSPSAHVLVHDRIANETFSPLTEHCALAIASSKLACLLVHDLSFHILVRFSPLKSSYSTSLIFSIPSAVLIFFGMISSRYYASVLTRLRSVLAMIFNRRCKLSRALMTLYTGQFEMYQMLSFSIQNKGSALTITLKPTLL